MTTYRLNKFGNELIKTHTEVYLVSMLLKVATSSLIKKILIAPKSRILSLEALADPCATLFFIRATV